MGSVTKDSAANCNGDDIRNESNSMLQQPQESSQDAIITSDNNGETKGSPETNKNDSATLSTAFTISFDDDSNTSNKKLFGIRDSIRKFAPPKPQTIEKPRINKSDLGQHDNSYMSIESAPGGYPRASLQRDTSNSCRSSSRRSDSSRHSNISESAAFLIDKMLNCEARKSTSPSLAELKSLTKAKRNPPTKDMQSEYNDFNELEFCDEKSDNGTYIVGADPESDDARKKIDELFGVVKAAEASVMYDSASKIDRALVLNRPSRIPDKKSINKDRQERINRLAEGRHSSRSSSSSRQDTGNPSRSRPRSATRQDCAETSRPRRAVSQSSRQSSNRDLSDGDTRSSHSSIHNELDGGEHGAQPSYGMKFNRAFALRRARLVLADPKAPPSTQEPESPRRGIAIGIASQRYGLSTSGGGSNLSRADGGRYSLRMKNGMATNRLNPTHSSSRTHQPANAVVESYLSRIASSKTADPVTIRSSNVQIQQKSPRHHHHQQSSTSMPLGALDVLVISAIRSLSLKIRSSICDLMVDHAKRLPADNETRLVVEEILPQLTTSTSGSKSPTSIEEIDQSLCFELAQTLKNLKKIEQMADVMKIISNQLPELPTINSSSNSRSSGHRDATSGTVKTGGESNTNSEANSLSPV